VSRTLLHRVGLVLAIGGVSIAGTCIVALALGLLDPSSSKIRFGLLLVGIATTAGLAMLASVLAESINRTLSLLEVIHVARVSAQRGEMLFQSIAELRDEVASMQFRERSHNEEADTSKLGEPLRGADAIAALVSSLRGGSSDTAQTHQFPKIFMLVGRFDSLRVRIEKADLFDPEMKRLLIQKLCFLYTFNLLPSMEELRRIAQAGELTASREGGDLYDMILRGHSEMQRFILENQA